MTARDWTIALATAGVIAAGTANAGESGKSAQPRSGSYAELIERHAQRHGVPPALARAVVRVESRENPRARNGVNVGLTQISYGTARRMGYSGGVEGLYDPDTNLAYGIRYLGEAYRLAGGDTCLTVLKYQAGHGARRMTRSAGVYCAKVRTQLAAAR